MADERKFETVSGGSNGKPWKPHMTEKNFMKMGTDNVKEGYLLSVRTVPAAVGKADSKPFDVYAIQVVKPDNSFGDLIEVVGDAVLTDKFKQISFGSFIRAEYKGRMHKAAIKKSEGYTPEAPFTQTNSYHNWEVGVDPNAIPYNEVVADQKGAGIINTPSNPIEQKNETTPGDKPEFNDNDDLPF